MKKEVSAQIDVAIVEQRIQIENDQLKLRTYVKPNIKYMRSKHEKEKCIYSFQLSTIIINSARLKSSSL